MRRGELIFNYIVALGPFIIGLGAVWVMGLVISMPLTTFWVMIALFLLGFLSFAKAKLSVIREGLLFTFGASKMTKLNRIAYYLGYSGMCLGFFLLIGFALAAR